MQDRDIETSSEVENQLYESPGLWFAPWQSPGHDSCDSHTQWVTGPPLEIEAEVSKAAVVTRPN